MMNTQMALIEWVFLFLSVLPKTFHSEHTTILFPKKLQSLYRSWLSTHFLPDTTVSGSSVRHKGVRQVLLEREGSTSPAIAQAALSKPPCWPNVDPVKYRRKSGPKVCCENILLKYQEKSFYYASICFVLFYNLASHFPHLCNIREILSQETIQFFTNASKWSSRWLPQPTLFPASTCRKLNGTVSVQEPWQVAAFWFCKIDKIDLKPIGVHYLCQGPSIHLPSHRQKHSNTRTLIGLPFLCSGNVQPRKQEKSKVDWPPVRAVHLRTKSAYL